MRVAVQKISAEHCWHTSLVRHHHSWCLEVMIFKEQLKCEARSNAEKHVCWGFLRRPLGCSLQVRERELGQGCESHRHRLQSPKDICITSFFVKVFMKYFRSILGILFFMLLPPLYNSHVLRCFPTDAAGLREIARLKRENIAGNSAVAQAGRHLSQTLMVHCCSGIPTLLFFLLSLQCCLRPPSFVCICMRLSIWAVTLPPVIQIFTWLKSCSCIGISWMKGIEGNGQVKNSGLVLSLM